jgi:RNA ligase (TIGR02306 family)
LQHRDRHFLFDIIIYIKYNKLKIGEIVMNEIEMTEIQDRDNLAVVVRIKNLISIPNKDRIEIAEFYDFGFTSIVEKGIHKKDSLVVFIKYDSVVPKNELFEFMKEYKYRVKAKSFTERDENDEVVKKIYSQGIVLPLDKVGGQLEREGWYKVVSDNAVTFSKVNEVGANVILPFDIEGYDLTGMLGVTKYIPPVVGSGSGFGVMKRKGDFPTHIVSKTDELNLASKVRALDEIQGKTVYITTKIEGSSLTVMWDESRDELMVCSRNNQIGEHETNKFWQAVNKYNLKERMIDSRWILQAELAGNGVQKNKLGIDGIDMFIFNIIHKDTRTLMPLGDMIDISDNLGVKLAPLISVIENFNMTFDELQELADTQKYDNGELAEGIVIRPVESFNSKILKGNWSVKIISREYKL